MRVNLLRAHGSPTQYQYKSSKCRCVACRAAMAECSRKYKAEHANEIAESTRKYRAAHPEKRAAYKRKWSAEHREEINECSRKHYAKHREELVERSRKYRAAHREKVAALNLRWRTENREKCAAYKAAHREGAAARRLEREYGLLPGEWDAMFAAQGNRCAVCGTDTPPGVGWHTDHDHDAGKVRGILCHHCNTGIGHFADDPERLMAAIEYLAAATL